ncbi:RNA degradosome polyphosphate kinase [Evansella cellulosilytica]|uniref:Polyphosphate kinase n=1 Tax=Evansella cellulosilytica (strain ATCC 21833 / DSM 2522 / FERM P-1141 / JCM 9156 / N-4) TaxID=649639 RepID=E6TXI0_EVAC2|nr:RNA degradosome polyphosphate kinase [Evansella cellulosilytica]ADU28794.1 Polyphosphate kinase [Evansella cellulosilytica DSM 2522]
MKISTLVNTTHYNNRELSWLAFNYRVLEEAIDERNLLMERFKFLSIFSSNLDEFFMVRVAGLTDQVKAGFTKPENKAGLTPKEQLTLIAEKTQPLVKKQYETYEMLLSLLSKQGISLTQINSLSREELFFLEQYFDEQIYPVLTPRAIDAYRPFPMLLNKSLNLAIVIDGQDNEHEQITDLSGKLAIVQVPSVLDRYVLIPSFTNERKYILLEDLITTFIHKLFFGRSIKSVTSFRITRNADLTIHEDEAIDLLIEIEKELKKRKWGAAVRLEIKENEYDHNVLKYLKQRLGIHEKDTYIVNGPLDLTFLFTFYEEIGRFNPSLIDLPMVSQQPVDLEDNKKIFDVALKKDILLHHPYDSFQTVVDFISLAANDPNVQAIKQTLYRVSGNSPIIHALKRAAINGKQVTVLIELKARFDEENNVSWAKELEKEGCHVIYGMTRLKTHSKITLIVRRMEGKIERFVHLGTGNYNDKTAKLYTDIGLITSEEEIANDATRFFNYISGYCDKPEYHHFSLAPLDIRDDFIRLIEKEIRNHEGYGNGRIIAKMNSLSDKKIIDKFYEASSKGVKIDLIIRGICCLRPGIKGVSENITVRSIVGQYLEHSRIYYFYHNGEEKTFISSADLMTRNMENRIEILFPLLSTEIKDRVVSWLLLYLSDNTKARTQDRNGNYHYVTPLEGEPLINSQLAVSNRGFTPPIQKGFTHYFYTFKENIIKKFIKTNKHH